MGAGWDQIAKTAKGAWNWGTTLEPMKWSNLGFSDAVAGPVKRFGGAVGSATKKVAIGGGKIALAGAALAGGVYAAASIVDSFRSRRENTPQKDDPLMAPDPYAEMGLLPSANTLMGMEPVEGKFAQQVIARRGGMAQGINPTAPDIEQDGRSTIDGRPVQNLGGIGM